MESKYISNWTSQLKKGVLPYLVLSIVQERPFYGYELIKKINQDFHTDVTDGTLYPILIRMYDEKILKYEWVEQSSGIPRKYYATTEKGTEIFGIMRSVIQNLLNIEK
ncbi:PadR family transcriptional regulator [Olivibacter sp. XZL3]|uniref:PadR family transcriptional regulator n=1 Tax=Olivibacter sp. XZL3 TaxID=1735116 RepID=UPI001416FF68|nr:PadR family transcriptional regulator [Olivibacter sp. XZL3]